MHQIRNSQGQFENIESLEQYILNKCKEHKSKKRAFAFCLIIYDFNNPHITKILEDDDYSNALDYTSGTFLTIFYVHSEYIRHQSEQAKKTTRTKMELSIHKVDSPKNISPRMLGEQLINDKNLPSPSVIFFNTSGNNITDHTIARLRENEIEKGFNELREIIGNAVKSVSEVKESNRGNEKDIFNLIKHSVDESELWKNVKSRLKWAINIKDFLFFWKI